MLLDHMYMYIYSIINSSVTLSWPSMVLWLRNCSHNSWIQRRFVRYFSIVTSNVQLYMDWCLFTKELYIVIVVSRFINNASYFLYRKLNFVLQNMVSNSPLSIIWWRKPNQLPKIPDCSLKVDSKSWERRSVPMDHLIGAPVWKTPRSVR